MFDLLLAAATHAAPALGGPADIWASIVKDFSNITEPAAFSAFLQVLMIDLVLAGDNAIVVGALAAGLPAEQRKKVILIGVAAALVGGHRPGGCRSARHVLDLLGQPRHRRPSRAPVLSP